MPDFTVNLPKSNVRAPRGAQMKIQGGTQKLNNDTEFNIVITPENEQYVPSIYVQKGLVSEPITIGYQGDNILQEYFVGAPVYDSTTNPFYHYVPNQDDIWPEPRNLIDKTISFKLRSNTIVTDVVLEVNKKYFSIHTPEAGQGDGEELIYLYTNTPNNPTLILDSQSEWYGALPLRGGLSEVVARFAYSDNMLPQGWYYLVRPQSDLTISTLQVTNNHYNNYTKMKIDREIIKLEGRTSDNKWWKWLLGAGGEFRLQGAQREGEFRLQDGLNGLTSLSTWSNMPLLPKVYHDLQTDPVVEDLHLINFFNCFFVLYKGFAVDQTLLPLFTNPETPNQFVITDRRFPYRHVEHCEFINWTGHSDGKHFYLEDSSTNPGQQGNKRALAFVLAEWEQ